METTRINFVKLLFLSFLFFVFSVPQVHAGTLTKPVSNFGLVGYWSFNEATGTKATDFSGNGNTGTLTNISAPASATSGWTSGKLGSAINFDGSDDYINIGTPASLDFSGRSQITLSAWVYPTGAQNYPSIIAKQDGANGLYGLVYGDNADLTPGLYLNIGGVWSEVVKATTAISLNQWTYVSATYDGATAKIYLNGVLSNSASVSGSISIDNSDNLYIGMGNTVSNITKGKIDEVRIYNRALSATEIANLYKVGVIKINSSKNILTNGLVGWWSFDGGAVIDKIYDWSGKGNNGYFSDGATSTAKVIGILGQAFNFNGVFNRFRVNLTSLGTLTSGTMSAWVYRNALDSPVIMESGVSDPSFEGSGATIDFWVNNFCSATFGAVSIGTWHHLLGTWDGTNIKSYLDGNLVTNSGCLSTETFGSFLAGGRDGTLPYNGKIDDIRIYNRALSSNEIKVLYQSAYGKINTASANLTHGTTLESGLVGYWSFNGQDVTDKVYDRSGSANNGYVYNGATSTMKVSGKSGQALNFDGTAFVLVPASSSLNFTYTTVCAWAKPTGTNDGLDIVGRQSGASNAANDFRLGVGNPPGSTWRFRIKNSAGTGAEGLSGTGYVVGQWQHVCGTFDGTNVTLYVNGVATNSSALSGSFAASATDVQLGAQEGNPGASRWMGGSDEIRIYNRALSASEIKQLYLIGK